jgi:hypothetical protein
MKRNQTTVKNNGASSPLQSELSSAAVSFAKQILEILRAHTLQDLSALQPGSSRSASASAPAAAPAQAPRTPRPRTNELKRIGGTRPVDCRVPGCSEPGVRAKMNFCRTHAQSLSREQRLRLRDAQNAEASGQVQKD